MRMTLMGIIEEFRKIYRSKFQYSLEEESRYQVSTPEHRMEVAKLFLRTVIDELDPYSPSQHPPIPIKDFPGREGRRGFVAELYNSLSSALTKLLKDKDIANPTSEQRKRYSQEITNSFIEILLTQNTERSIEDEINVLLVENGENRWRADEEMRKLVVSAREKFFEKKVPEERENIKSL